MRSGADFLGRSPLVSFDHVINPHFCHFSSSLYTATPTLTLIISLTLTMFLTVTLNLTLTVTLQ